MRVRKIVGIFVGKFGRLRAEAADALSSARREKLIWFSP
jgi:hypothetical protein